MDMVFVLLLLCADGQWYEIARYEHSKGPAICRRWEDFGGKSALCKVETKV